jgi:hypothetical protein
VAGPSSPNRPRFSCSMYWAYISPVWKASRWTVYKLFTPIGSPQHLISALYWWEGPYEDLAFVDGLLEEMESACRYLDSESSDG